MVESVLVPFPDPRMGMPELLVPGRKPVGEVEIDWSHPLSRGLKYCFPILDSNLRLLNLVDNKQTDIVNTGGGLHKSITNKGIATDIAESVQDYWLVQNPHVMNAEIGTTVMMLIRHTAVTTWDFGLLKSTANRHPLRARRTAMIESEWDQGFLKTSSLSIADTNWHWFGFTLDASGKRFFLDNSFDSQAATKTGYTTTIERINSDSSQDGFAGQIAYLFAWEQNFTDAELLSLQENPYQFLIPKTPAFFPVPRRELEDDRFWLKPKMSMPEMLVPNRKPVGAVEIDWSHPLSKGLTNYTLIQSLDPYNLTNNKKQSLIGTITSAKLDIKERKRALQINVSSDDGMGIDTGESLFPATADFSSSFVFIINWSHIGGYLLGQYTGGVPGRFFVDLDPDYPRVRALMGTYYIYFSLPYVLEVHTLYTFVFQREAGIFTLYLNGEYCDSVVDSVVIQTTTTTKVGTRDGSLGFRGWVGDYSFRNVALSEVEIKSLYYNPYQFLKPKSAPLLIDSGNSIKDGFFLPDAKMFQPEMLVPGRKPVGDVEIDRDHWLGAYLRTCIINPLSGKPRNIGDNPNWPEYTGDILSQAQTLHGPMGIWDYTPIAESVRPVDPPFTLHARFFRIGNWTSAIEDAFGFESTSGDVLTIKIGSYNHQVYVRYNYGAAVSIVLDGGTNTGDYSNTIHDIFLVCNSDGDWEAYLYTDGNLRDSGVSTTVVGNFTAYTRMWFGTTKHGGAFIELGTHYSKALSISEISSLVQNPYQFLKPKSQPKYIPPSDHGFNLPESRMEMPELFMPGRKPTGKVRIDWGHFLTKGLAAFGLGEEDLVSNIVLNYYNNKAERKNGDLHFNETRNGESLVLDHFVRWADSSTERYMFVIAKFHGSSSADEDTLMGMWAGVQGSYENDAKRYFLRYSTTANQLQCFANTGSTIESFGDVTDAEDGDFHSFGLLHREGKLYPVYDGVVLGSGITCGTLVSINHSKRPEVMGGQQSTGTSTSDSPRFDLRAWGMFDIAISDIKIKALHDNPYQFLIPDL